MPRLTVSIVNFNGGKFLLDCLKSLGDVQKEVWLSVYIVDNASWDGSIAEARKKFPKFHYLLNDENLGFGKANNLVLKKVDTDYLLILNPDTQIMPGTLKKMIEFMEENPDVGAASCSVVKADGSIYWASHRGFPTPWASFLYFVFGDDSLYHLTNKDMTKPHEVDAISGAFFLIRRLVLEKVGYFDEDYFLYAEDIDLCYRIKQAGFKIMYVPDVKIIHYHGVTSGIKKHSQDVSTANLQSKIVALNSFYKTMLIFYKKNFAKKYPFFINWLIYLGINTKWFLARRSRSV